MICQILSQEMQKGSISNPKIIRYLALGLEMFKDTYSRDAQNNKEKGGI